MCNEYRQFCISHIYFINKRGIKTMEKLLKIEQELKAIQEEGNKQVVEFKAEIQTANDNEEQANKAVIKAKQGDDPKAYAKAIEDKRTASDIASFYTGKIEEIKNEPYITKAQYKEYTNRIKSEMDRINQQASERVSELLEELEAIQSELTPAYDKTNELLSTLQNNIYKYSAEKQMQEAKETGKAIKGNELRNEYKDSSVISGIEYILNSHVAKDINWKVNR